MFVSKKNIYEEFDTIFVTLTLLLIDFSLITKLKMFHSIAVTISHMSSVHLSLIYYFMNYIKNNSARSKFLLTVIQFS